MATWDLACRAQRARVLIISQHEVSMPSTLERWLSVQPSRRGFSSCTARGMPL